MTTSEPRRFVLSGKELALLLDGLPGVEPLPHVLDLSFGVCDLLSEKVVVVEQRLALARELGRTFLALRLVRRRFQPSLDLVVKLSRRLVTIGGRFGESAQARFFELERDVGVPAACPDCVVSARASVSSSVSTISLATPQSRRSTSPCSPIMMLGGLKSRCTTPLKCAYSSASATCKKTCIRRVIEKLRRVAASFPLMS